MEELNSKKNTNSIYCNKVKMISLNGAEYSEDLLKLRVYSSSKELRIKDLLEQSYDIGKTYYKNMDKLESLSLDFNAVKTNYNNLKDTLKEYITSIKDINALQSKTIDTLNDKISILVSRIENLEEKIKLL